MKIEVTENVQTNEFNVYFKKVAVWKIKRKQGYDEPAIAEVQTKKMSVERNRQQSDFLGTE